MRTLALARSPLALGVGIAAAVIFFLWLHDRRSTSKHSAASSAVVNLVTGVAGSLIAGAVLAGVTYYAVPPSSSSPDHGLPLPSVTTRASTLPANSVYLLSLSPTGTTPMRGVGVIDEHQYAQSLYYDVDCCPTKPFSSSYELPSAYSLFQSVLGLEDATLDSVPVQFEVTLDGVRVFSTSLALHESCRLVLPLKGAKRLVISMKAKIPSRAVWGDAELVITPDTTSPPSAALCASA